MSLTSSHSRLRGWLAATVISALGLAAALGGSQAAVAAPAPTTISIDGNAPGRVFDGGIGALSAGASSRLLIDYPATQRGQILDYLFKPNYGASLQHLKVEIGGDTNSTDGSEHSHMHVDGTVSCSSGYEWWMAKEAIARNPNMQIHALAWGAPSWIGEGKQTVWTASMQRYLITWLDCAKQNGITITTLGGWNERGFDPAWFISLRKELDSKGYPNVKLIADDSFNASGLGKYVVENEEFRNAIGVQGSHYVCGYLAAADVCNSGPEAIASGQPIWASEGGSAEADGQAPAIARQLNRQYIDGKFTGFTHWPVVAAFYRNLNFSNTGILVANEPWSGHYRVGKALWTTAHTSQFIQRGWRYIDSASGYLAGNRANGSFTTARSQTTNDWSTIVETMDAKEAQSVTLKIGGGLSTGPVSVWATNVKSNDDRDWFNKLTTLTPVNGAVTFTAQPGYNYSLTTTTGQSKGVAKAPATATMPLPYWDNFETPTANSSPKFLSDMNGAFERISTCKGGSGSCLRQMAPAQPVRWTGELNTAPYTFMGDASWTNYTVTVDALWEQPGDIEVLGRIGTQAGNNNGLDAYHLRVNNNGTWSILKSDRTWTFTTLKTGTMPAFPVNAWHRLAFTMQGTTLTASLDGTVLGSVTDATYARGQAGFGLTAYTTQEFDNFSVTPGTGGYTSGGIPAVGDIVTLTSAVSGQNANVLNNSTSNGATVGQWGSTPGATNEQFRVGAGSVAGTFTFTAVHSGKCLNIAGGSAADGAKAIQWPCVGATNETFELRPSVNGGYALIAQHSRACLTVPGNSVTAGTALDQFTCQGSPNQSWRLAKVG